MKLKNKFALGALAFAGAAVGVAVVGNKINGLVDLYLSKSHLTPKKKKESKNHLDFINSQEHLLAELFYISTPHINISIPNRSGRHINGLLFKQDAESSNYAILCHGYTSNPRTLCYLARHYFEKGYNVLLPYSRAHEGSDYDYCTMGWHERFDVIDWINYVDRTANDAHIVLHGVSMGGATVMMVTGEPLPSCVKVCIDDCGFTSVYDIYKYQIPNALHIPPYPAIDIFRYAVKRRVGFDIKEASALEQVKKSHIPTLFIHGTADTTVPCFMADELYAAAACPKEKLIFRDIEHTMCPIFHTEEYWQKVFEFIEQYDK